MVYTLPTPNSSAENHIVFYDASWTFYEALLREYDEQPTRVNYDRGTLEMMTLSMEHEGFKRAVGRFVDAMTEELDVPIASRGSTTLRRPELRRGLESDECYWIANESVVRNVKRLDLNVHPPPDLVIEVDVTHSVVDREAIYLELGVPEMWRVDPQTLLTAWAPRGGVWARIERSLTLPMVRIADLNGFLQRVPVDGETRVVRDLRAWFRTLPH